MVIPQSIDQPTATKIRNKGKKREEQAAAELTAPPRMESGRFIHHATTTSASSATTTPPCITVTLLDLTRRARSEGHRLHFLQQLQFLLVPDSSEGDGDDHDGERRDDDGNDDGADSIHKTYRSRALDQSIDHHLMGMLVSDAQQQQQQQQEQLPQTPTGATTATSIAVKCLTSLWKHASQERRQYAFRHWVGHATSLVFLLRRRHLYHEKLGDNILRVFRTWTKSTKDQVLVGKLVHSPGFLCCLRDCLTDASSSYHKLATGLIKEVSFRASARDNQLMHTNLAEGLSKRLVHDLDPAPSERDNNTNLVEAHTILAIYWKFSTDPAIALRMADDTGIWQVLHRVTSTNMNAESLVSHRHAASIVGCIMATLCEGQTIDTKEDEACAPPPQLVQRRNVASDQFEWILSHVHRVFRAERDDDLRRRWMRLLRCWAGSEWGRTTLFRRTEWLSSPNCDNDEISSNENEGLMTLLVQVLRQPEESVDVRCQACQAIANLLPSVGQLDQGHLLDGTLGPLLESILMEAIEDDRTPTKLMVPLCDALNASLLHNNRAWKRGPSNCSTSFYERLVSAIQEGATDSTVHDRISNLVLNLVETHPTIPNQALHHLADLAAALVTPVGPEYERSRENGVAIVDVIVSSTDATAWHKKILADNEKLLSALVGYCLQHHIDASQKDRAKRLIIELVPEL